MLAVFFNTEIHETLRFTSEIKHTVDKQAECKDAIAAFDWCSCWNCNRQAPTHNTHNTNTRMGHVFTLFLATKSGCVSELNQAKLVLV